MYKYTYKYNYVEGRLCMVLYIVRAPVFEGCLAICAAKVYFLAYFTT